MGDKDPVAAAAQKYKPIQSAVPGTTLGPIQIEAFFGGGVHISDFKNFIVSQYLFEFCCICLVIKSQNPTVQILVQIFSVHSYTENI